jgi:hypothetical protein
MSTDTRQRTPQLSLRWIKLPSPSDLHEKENSVLNMDANHNQDARLLEINDYTMGTTILLGEHDTTP